jgi:hypothetical protein
MSTEQTTTRSRRPLIGLTIAAVVLAAPYLIDRVLTQGRERRVAEEAGRKAREAADLARDALAVQTEAVAMMTENAVANPRFLAALRGRVDRTTLADLLSTESWWRRIATSWRRSRTTGRRWRFRRRKAPTACPSAR